MWHPPRQWRGEETVMETNQLHSNRNYRLEADLLEALRPVRHLMFVIFEAQNDEGSKFCLLRSLSSTSFPGVCRGSQHSYLNPEYCPEPRERDWETERPNMMNTVSCLQGVSSVGPETILEP